MDEIEKIYLKAQEQAELCKTFAYPRRILILWVLAGGDLVVGEIAKAIGASVQNTSHHLRIMKGIGILRAKRDGKTIRYSIADKDRCESLLSKAPKSVIP
jgi:ArsR family transcriptional regulator